MGLPKRLTEMQKRFAELLVFGGPDGPLTKTEAAKLAGYSEKRCRQEGSELTNPKLNPLVAKYLGELREERLKKHEVTHATHVAELARIKELALKKISFSAAVNAETSPKTVVPPVPSDSTTIFIVTLFSFCCRIVGPVTVSAICFPP